MSSSTDVAHESASPGVRISLRQVGTLATAIGLMMAIWLFISYSSEPQAGPPTEPATGGQMSHEQFLDLNTAALVGPAAAVATDPTRGVDPFLYWNTTALDLAGGAGAAAELAADGFLYWNTTALEYSGSTHPEPTRGPR